jgi:glycosyltransferase involved in cell wall biosynthesis
MRAGNDWAVDVVIPVRNGARYIARCLDSIIAQSMPARATVVVDDGSTDDTAAIVEGYMGRWPALQLVQTGKRGLPHARNTGIANCQAPFVAFLDSDDVWEPSKLERQMRLFSTAPSRVGLVYCSYYHIDEAGRRLEGRRIVEPRRRHDLLHDLLVEGNIVSGSGSAVVVRRELLERTGGFDEKLTFGEDWDLWLRLAEVAEFDFVPDALVGIRLHDQSMQRSDASQREKRFLLQTLLILDRWYQTPKFPPELRVEYRRTVVHLAILKAKREPALQLPRQLELFREIKGGSGRFGRDLFSGPFDFFVAIYRTRLNSARRRLRHFAAKNVKSSWYWSLSFLTENVRSVLGTLRTRSQQVDSFDAMRGGVCARAAQGPGSTRSFEINDVNGVARSGQQKTMRLLICCESYHPSRGGVQEVMRQIAERLALAGHDVTVATSYLSERDFTSHNGVAIRAFKVAGNAIVGMSGAVDRYRDFVVNFRADAILVKAAQQWTFDALWPALDQIEARKVFIPCGFSGLYETAYAAYFAQLPDVLRKFDHLIFYAEKYRDIDFARAHGLTHYSVLPNGASELEFEAPRDGTFRDRLGISPNDFVVLTVGAPVATKGHRPVVEAFARLDTKGRPATLILNADWPRPFQPRSTLIAAPRRATSILRRSLQMLRRHGWAGFQAGAKARIKRTRLEREIGEWIRKAESQPHKRVLCTNLSRADLVQAFMATDLFVFASIVEYSPLVLFEAAAAGTPFLSVPVGNAEEIARWTGGGVICPAAKDERGYTRVDPSVLAREMERCMADPDRLARLGAAGKETWRRMFTWQAIAPQYESILSGGTSDKEPQESMSGETAARV